MTRCQACEGTGWLRRMVDVSTIYGRPMINSYSRICPRCGGEGTVVVTAEPTIAQDYPGWVTP